MTTIAAFKNVRFSAIPASGQSRGAIPRGDGLSMWGAGPWPWVLLSMAGIFVLDLNTSLGVTAGALYSIPLMIAALVMQRGAVLGAASLASGLIGVGWLLSPGNAPGSMMALNRGISLVVVWAPALVIMRIATRAERCEGAVRQERAGASELREVMRAGLTKLLTLIEQVGRSGATGAQAAQRIRARTQVLLSALGMLSRSRGEAVEFRTILRSMLPASSAEVMRMEGPELLVPARQVPAVATVLHELLINCRAHGALSAGAGRIDVGWSVELMETEPSRRVTMMWREMGGRPIEGNPSPGFGTSVISGTVVHDLSGSVALSYPAAGCVHRFEFILEGPGVGPTAGAGGRPA